MKTFILISITMFSSLFSFSFQDLFFQSKTGDYIVTKNNNTFSLLLIERVEGKFITLHEISFLGKNPPPSWRKWVKGGAKKNSSWNIYEIEKEKGIIECYSKSKNCFFNLDDQENFFKTLLNLNLHPLKKDKIKKIGPKPLSGPDTRSIWKPALYIDGKRIKKESFKVYRTIWPKDKSTFSLKKIDLYFIEKRDFSLPIWIEISGDHLKFILKVVDSGRGLTL